MLKRLTAQLATALMLALGGIGAASAQIYDGSGLVKFGVFAQGMFLDVDQTAPVVASSSPEGFTGGVSAGYDLRLPGHWLIGFEIDGSFGDARARAGLTDYGFDWLLTARGRLGVYARPDWLLYATAGIGALGIEAQRPGIGIKEVETVAGFVGGAGTEIAWHHVLFFGEYLYGSFEDARFSIGGLDHRAGFEMHTFRLGLKFKVGHDFAHDYTHPEHHKRHDTLK